MTSTTPRPARRPLGRRALGALAALAVAVAALSGLQGAVAPAARAAVASSFDPGNIISDPVFRDDGSMSAAGVQAFLSGRVGTCASGATCLKDYTQDTTTRTDSTGMCSTYPGASGETAAQIIVKVAQACSINPQVLIVLLEKEQGLVSATNPSPSKYLKATGYGCPDTSAGCNSLYYGFFNQVFLAARQFDLYMSNPSKYGYQAGRSNFIQYDVSTSCGGSLVYITNAATAALYDYTPYQPDGAALGNLYGSGDSCSAYGNRNFWRLFTDWFGAPQTGGFFVHANGSNAVYLVTPAAKLPVSSMALVQAFAPLGSVGTVSASYLASLPTGAPLGNLVSDGDGDIYLVDAGLTHHVPSCDLVADYGGVCGALPVISDVQAADLTASTDLTSTFKSPTSPVLRVADGGHQREVLDWSALLASGASTTATTLSTATTSRLSVAAPLVSEDVVVTARDSGQVFLLQDGGASLVPPGLVGLPVFSGRRDGMLDGPSIQALGFTPTQTGAVTDGSTSFLLTSAGGRVAVTPGALAGVPARSWDATLLAAAPLSGPATAASAAFVQPASGQAVYRTADGTARQVVSWADLVALAGTGSPTLSVVPNATVAAMSVGEPVLAPGQVVKTATANDVWVLDGASSRLHLPSFAIASQLGLPGLRTVPAGSLDGYATSGDLSNVVSCPSSGSGSGSTTSVGVGGRLRALPAGTALPATSLAASTCATLRTGTALTSPVAVQETGSSVVWVVAGSVKRQATSWPALVRALGTSSPTIAVVPARTLSSLTTGTPAS